MTHRPFSLPTAPVWCTMAEQHLSTPPWVCSPPRPADPCTSKASMSACSASPPCTGHGAHIWWDATKHACATGCGVCSPGRGGPGPALCATQPGHPRAPAHGLLRQPHRSLCRAQLCGERQLLRQLHGAELPQLACCEMLRASSAGASCAHERPQGHEQRLSSLSWCLAAFTSLGRHHCRHCGA